MIKKILLISVCIATALRVDAAIEITSNDVSATLVYQGKNSSLWYVSGELPVAEKTYSLSLKNIDWLRTLAKQYTPKQAPLPSSKLSNRTKNPSRLSNYATNGAEWTRSAACNLKSSAADLSRKFLSKFSNEPVIQELRTMTLQKASSTSITFTCTQDAGLEFGVKIIKTPAATDAKTKKSLPASTHVYVYGTTKRIPNHILELVKACCVDQQVLRSPVGKAIGSLALGTAIAACPIVIASLRQARARALREAEEMALREAEERALRESQEMATRPLEQKAAYYLNSRPVIGKTFVPLSAPADTASKSDAIIELLEGYLNGTPPLPTGVQPSDVVFVISIDDCKDSNADAPSPLALWIENQFQNLATANFTQFLFINKPGAEAYSTANFIGLLQGHPQDYPQIKGALNEQNRRMALEFIGQNNATSNRSALKMLTIYAGNDPLAPELNIDTRSAYLLATPRHIPQNNDFWKTFFANNS